MAEIHNLRYILSCLVILGIGQFALSQAPVADFTANITSGCSPLAISFTDASTNGPNQWNWDFGNSNNSSLQNPSAVYSVPGTYTVTLTATNGSGSDTQVKVAFITVFSSPVAAITADTVVGCIPLTVQFSDQSAPGSGAINDWIWDFGDGNVSTLQNPSHPYVLNGGFSVSLTVTDINGCQNTIFESNFINLSTPASAAISGGPIDTCNFPVSISFGDLSTPGSASIENWVWDFGDGSGINPFQNPNHTFTSPGSYDVTLIVSDSLGCPDTVVLVDYINVVNFQAGFVIDTLSACPNFVLIFNDATTPNPITWDWDFGDGNTSTNQNPLYFYDSAGTYNVELVAENAFGCKDSVTQSVVFNKPSASFVLDTTKACSAPLNVTFTSTVSGSAPLTYDWDFDDGSPNSSLSNPTHAFTTLGIFFPFLVITDALGCTDTFFLAQVPDTIIVLPPVADFTLNPPDGGCKPLTISFTDNSSTGIGIINSWAWDFDDPLSGASNSSTSQNPSHTFDSSGVYGVQLTIGTDLGCTATISIDALVGITPVIVDFLMSASVVCHNELVDFNDLSGDSINNWLWMFGNSADTSTLQNPSWAFADTGSITVTLIAGHNGCNDTMERTIVVVPPIPIWTVDSAIGCTVPHPVTFTDFSIGADTWFWDFGDGFTSTSANNSHTYTAPGSYTVKLLITNSGSGCTDSSFASVVIPDLQADFTASDTVGCFGLSTTFTNTSSWAYTPSILASWWNYGDGGFDNTGGPFGFSHNFTDTGAYDVQLILTDFYGCVDTIIKKNYIKINGVYPAYTYNPNSGCAPLLITFTDTSFASIPINSWTWNFGDISAVDTVQNPQHLYDEAGVYSVELIIVDSNGCADSVTLNNIISATRPNPSFAYKSNICINEDLAIVDSSWGDGLSYYWDFGDGDNDSIANPLHGYSDTGAYTLTLTLTDSNGCDSILVNLITVSPTSTAGIVVDAFNTSCPPLVVSFQDSSSADVVSWFWDFGDGATSANQNPIHTYSYPDTLDVMLAVANATGCVDTLILPDLIQIGGPYGTFNFNPDSGCVPLDVVFTSSAFLTTLYIWDFGDGVIDSTSGSTASHTYLNSGAPHPALLVSDSLGCQLPALPPDPDSLLIDDPVALLGSSTTLLYSTLCGLDTVYFYDSSSVQSPYTSIISWNWDFGDGNSDTIPNTMNVYADTGTYLVTLEILTDLGCLKIDSVYIAVKIDLINVLTATIPFLTDVLCGGDNTGNATGLAVGGALPYSYLWSDDSLQTDSFATGLIAGVYKFNVIDSNGCVDSASVTINEPPELLAEIMDSSMITCNGLANGYATVLGTGGSGSYSYLWDDPSFSTSDSIAGLDVDTFIVVITDSIGCTADDSVIITQPSILVASSGNQANVFCFGDSTGLALASVSGGTPPYSYTWNTVTVETDIFVDSLWAGGYTITVLDSFSCNTNYTFTITQPTALTSLWIDTIKIECFNDTLGGAVIEAIGGTSPYTIVWPSIADTSFSVDSFWIDSLWAGTHVYVLEDTLGCIYSDSIELLQPTPINILINVGDGTICRYGTDSIQAGATGGTGNLSYTWGSGLGTDTSWKVVMPVSDSIFHLTVSDENGCTEFDSVEIIVFDLIRVSVSADTLCIGDSIGLDVFVISGADSSYSYVWNFGDGVIDTTSDTNATHIYSTIGYDVVDLFVIGPDACVTDSLLFDTLTILASPRVDFIADPLETSTNSPLITFLDTSYKSVVIEENIVGYYWDFGDGDGSFFEDDTHFYLDSGTYSVTHSIINEIGCTDTMRVEIRINPSFEIEIPNAFTPDPMGPSGGLYDPSALDNNIFYPITKFVRDYRMLIFNRWGELIFESLDLAVGWDGYYREQLSQQDVYVWKIELTYINGTEFKQIGDVTLVR